MFCTTHIDGGSRYDTSTQIASRAAASKVSQSSTAQ
jgi:hypothetical protein